MQSHDHACPESNTKHHNTRWFFKTASLGEKAHQKSQNTIYTSGNGEARAGKMPSSVTKAKPSDASIAAVEISPTPIFDPTRGE